jgi:hypothetical protein
LAITQLCARLNPVPIAHTLAGADIMKGWRDSFEITAEKVHAQYATS